MVAPATKKEPHKEERSKTKKTKFITQKFGLLIQKYLSLVFYDRKKKWRNSKKGRTFLQLSDRRPSVKLEPLLRMQQ
jgi:hypothetical protein